MKKNILLMLLSVTLFASAQNTQSSYNVKRALEAAQSQDWETSISFLADEVQTNPTNGYAYAYLAAICQVLDYHQHVLNSARKALKFLPKKDADFTGQMYHFQALVYWEAEDTVRAEQLWREALAADKTNMLYANNVGSIMEEQKRYDEMEAFARTCLKNKALAQQPLSHNLLASAQNALKQYEAAIESADKGLALCGEDDDRKKSQLLDTKTEALIALHRYEEALATAMTNERLQKGAGLQKIETIADSADMQTVIDTLEAAMLKNPTNYLWALTESDIYAHKRDYVQSVYQCMRAAKIEESAHVYTIVAEILENHIGAPEMSEEIYRKALETDSTYARAWMGLAILYHDMGRYEDALNAVDHCLELDPEHKRTGSIYSVRGLIYQSMHNYERALEDYMRELTMNPDNRHHWSYLGTLYYALGDSAEAQRILAQGIREMGDDVGAEMYIVMGDTAKAYEKTQTMVKNETSASQHYNAACAYSRIRHTDEAMVEFKRALELGFRNFYHIAWDDDLDHIRNLPEFVETVNRYKAISQEETAELKRLIANL